MEEMKTLYDKVKYFCTRNWKKLVLLFASIFAAIFSFWQINIRKKEIVAIDSDSHALTREMFEKLDKSEDMRALSREIVEMKSEERTRELLEDTEKIDRVLTDKVGLKKWDMQ